MQLALIMQDLEVVLENVRWQLEIHRRRRVVCGVGSAILGSGVGRWWPGRRECSNPDEIEVAGELVRDGNRRQNCTEP